MELKVLVIKCTKFFITIQLNLNIGIWDQTCHMSPVTSRGQRNSFAPT